MLESYDVYFNNDMKPVIQVCRYTCVSAHTGSGMLTSIVNNIMIIGGLKS